MSYSKKNKLWYAFSIVVLLGLFLAYSTIYKSHHQIEKLDLTFIGTAGNFEDAIQESPDDFVNAIVKLNGKISNVDPNGVILSQSIFCQFRDTESLTELKPNTEITLKGRYIGYDDLLDEIKLDQCIIVKPELK